MWVDFGKLSEVKLVGIRREFWRLCVCKRSGKSFERERERKSFKVMRESTGL